MHAKKLYPPLFKKFEPDPLRLLDAITTEKDHAFWFAARDSSKEILKENDNWKWLSYMVDDFGNLVEETMRKKIQKWKFKAQLGVGAMAKRLQSTEVLTAWLLDRYVAELKNLFDKRSRNYIDLNQIQLTILSEAEDFRAIV